MRFLLSLVTSSVVLLVELDLLLVAATSSGPQHNLNLTVTYPTYKYSRSLTSTSPKYNLIYCKSDLWCFQPGVDENGNAVPPDCESGNGGEKQIDPIMPNYHERGLLQINNYARMFVDSFEEEYSKYFEETCRNTIPHHPLWETKGATEEAHFLSVSSRDCSKNPSSHNTCKDYCYESTTEFDDTKVYKPLSDCKAGNRKNKFEWYALKHGYEEFTGTKKIHTNAEARCGADFPCVDGGHCGAVFNPTRWMTGVGRAEGTPENPNPNTYFKGARTYAFGGNSYQLQDNYWEKYGDTSLLHRIPSGSHFDKCRLMRNCGDVGYFQSGIVFQFMYAHYEHTWVDNTAFVYINGRPRSMNVKQINGRFTEKKPKEDGTTFEEKSTWGVFEYLGEYPTACMEYYFEIQTEDNKTIRLPEDERYTFATTGNGCDLNSYYKDDQDIIWKNCKGEYSGADDPTVQAATLRDAPTIAPIAPTKIPTKAPVTAPTKNPTNAPTKQPTKNPTKQPTKNPTKQPTKNPTEQPTKAPVVAPTNNPTKEPTKAPVTTCTSTETIIHESYDDKSAKKVRNKSGWTKNERTNPQKAPVTFLPDYGQILGRFVRNQVNGEPKESTVSKTFVVENASDTTNLLITFKLFEFDKFISWKEEGHVKINNHQIALGPFSHSETQQQSDYSFFEPIDNGKEYISIERKSQQMKNYFVQTNAKSQKMDEMHSVSITVPSVVYQENDDGKLKVEISFLFRKGKKKQSFGIDDFTIVANRNC